jgi:Pyruvate/2-oxoacid:ferredoxin oxidoreductase delta subunit
MEDIKNCPQCNGVNIHSKLHNDKFEPNKTWWYLQCYGCGYVSKMCHNEDSAIKAWNEMSETEE